MKNKKITTFSLNKRRFQVQNTYTLSTELPIQQSCNGLTNNSDFPYTAYSKHIL